MKGKNKAKNTIASSKGIQRLSPVQSKERSLNPYLMGRILLDTFKCNFKLKFEWRHDVIMLSRIVASPSLVRTHDDLYANMPYCRQYSTYSVMLKPLILTNSASDKGRKLLVMKDVRVELILCMAFAHTVNFST